MFTASHKGISKNRSGFLFQNGSRPKACGSAGALGMLCTCCGVLIVHVSFPTLNTGPLDFTG